jgi:hypothetical protein
VQFAREGLLRRFARLDLAARELPITGVNLPGGPLREEKAPVRLLQHGRGDFDTLA